ncbi:EF-hand calcium-binding domain-containing protein 6-like [Acanthaster planci]|uniref:EF-hand calcium-binding domain-containing protein 6-like n=1 Tax=Acanthaster planci TaxID=133434 RepID=A0A8B7XF22_ACAPL|nr:EF-hand calcium-binding domain-containing protein 6-like [Acanthaster planci]
MATAVVQNRRPTTSAGIPSNLPVIEHPRARLGDKNTLNVRGSNRGDLITPLGRCSPPSGDEGRAGGDAQANGLNRNLPPLKKGEGVPVHSKEKENRQLGESLDSSVGGGFSRRKHNRMLTWPPVHEQQPGEKRAFSARVQGVYGTPRKKYVPEELFEIIREKLTTSFHGLQQLFRANDPQGNSTVSKIALTRILYHLVGYLTREEVQKLLARLGLDEMETVSFDNFIACFRDNETVKREWLSPAARMELSAERKKNHLEDHLCFKKPVPELVMATYANALLKEKCRHSDFDIRRHLAPSCFDPGAVILPPQLEECLASLGVRLDDYEMQKLWERYDLENTGAVNSSWFFIQIGLDSRGHHLARAKTAPPRVRNQPRTPWVPQIPEETQELVEETENVEPPMERPPTDVPRPPSVDIISFLLRKMEQNYHGFLMGFEHFDHSNDGTVSRAQFRDILLEYDLPMVPAEIEHLLERASLRRKDGRVNYRDFLHKFMSRMNNGIAHRIIMDGTHRFNTRAQTPAGPLTAQDAEAKLVEMFHKDFLRLLATLKSQDQYNLKLITQKQFRDSVDRVFGIRMSDLQLDQILVEMGVNLDDLVPYPEFLAIFNRKRPPLVLRSQTPRPQSQQLADRSSPTATVQRVPTPEDYVVPPNLAGPVEFGDGPRQSGGGEGSGRAASVGTTKRKGMETRYRPVKEMEDTIEELLRRRGYEAQEAYHKIDRKATGRLSKTQLHQWLQELGVLLHPTELQTLWSALDIARDGLVHYAELFDYFISRSRRREAAAAATAAAKFNRPAPQRRSPILREAQSQPQVRKRPSNEDRDQGREFFGTPAEDIVARIRPQVLQSWDELKMCLREMDPYGVAMVPIPQFQALLKHVHINLSPGQFERLSSRFDFSQNGQFHYLQFLQLFVDSNRKSSKTGIRVTDQNEKGGQQMTVSSALIKIRKQLLHDWKSLRRAFKKADLNHDGYLNVPEFRRILAESKIRFDEEDFYHIVSELDKNLDGRISYDEFISSMMSV